MSGPTITHCIHESNNELIKSLKTGQGLQGQKNPLFEVCSRCETCAKAPKRCELIQKKFFYIFIALKSTEIFFYNLIQNVVLLS